MNQAVTMAAQTLEVEFCEILELAPGMNAVSYTHLTLPTSDLV